MFSKILILLITLFFIKISFADECLDWFVSSKIKKSDKECVSKCNLYPKDMGTFACSNECNKFCDAQKCKVDPFWKNKIKSGRPEKWDNFSEKTIEWTKLEKERLEKVLNRFPDEFKKIPLEGVYRMKKSTALANPGSTSLDGRFIVLYDAAFEVSNWTPEEVLVHEFGHAVFVSYPETEKNKYKNSLGWEKGQSRTSGFVSSTAKEDSDEDFAENFKYLLLYSDQLSLINSKAFKWFSIKYKKQLKLKQECL